METGIKSRSGPFLVNLFSFCQKFSKPASLPPHAADVAINLVERDAGSASHVWQPKYFPGHLPPSPRRDFQGASEIVNSDVNFDPGREGGRQQPRLFGSDVECAKKSDRIIDGHWINIRRAIEFMGYTLLPSNKFERFLWLVGSGANGKSVLLRVMAGLVGHVNTTYAHLDRLNKTAVRAALEGVMLNISTEMNAEGTMADGYLKSITSGEAVDAEPKYKDPYSFIPTVKLVAGTNHLPRLKDTSGGFARRAIILSCNKVFAPEERDANLAETLAGELDGILVWALEGLERLLKRNRFVPPPSSDTMVQTYRTEADSVAMFNHDCLEPCEAGTSSGILYAAYREFCTTNGFQPTNVAIFGRRLTEVGITTLRKSAGKPIRAAKFRTAAEQIDQPMAANTSGKVVSMSRKNTQVSAAEMFGDDLMNGTEG